MINLKKFLVLIFSFLLTGCSSYNMTMEINKNKSMDFSITILSDNNVDFSNNISYYNKKLEKYGYSVSKYTKDNKHGIYIFKHFDNIDNISNAKRSDEFNLLYFYNNDYSSGVESKMFNIDKSFDSNRYAANFYVDLADLDIDINNAVVTYKIYVPNGTESNNADNVSPDGNELTWNINSLDKTEIDFVFSLKSYDYIYYGVAVLIIVFLIFAIFSNLFTKSSHSNGNFEDVAINANNYDIDKKIENITKNVKRDGDSGYNNVVNTEYNNNVIISQKNIIDNTNSVNSKPVNMDDINKKNITGQNSFNSSSNINVLVPEVSMSNFEAPVHEKKKGLFSKFGKKSNDAGSLSSDSNINFDNNYSAMVDIISNNNNYTQSAGSTVNVNSQIAHLDEKNTQQIIDNNSNVPVLGGENINNKNTIVGNVGSAEHVNIKSNLNVDVNNVRSNSSLVDSFQYIDERANLGVAGEEELETINDVDETVINVNNSSFVVKNNKKKDL